MTNKQPRKNMIFGLTLAILLTCISAWKYYQLREFNLLSISAAIILAFVALLHPKWLYFPRVMFEKIGYYLGTINTYMILTLIYIFLFIPFGLFAKLAGKDILKLKYAPNAKSYWIEKSTIDRNRMKNQF